MKRFALALLASGLVALPVQAASHVRVVLDVSGSLKKEDPGRKVILATQLLYDLARPNTTLDDTFKVLPFDESVKTDAGSWDWKDPSAPVPVSQRPWIEAATNHRDDFVGKLRRQQYDSVKTYFYPGILRSIEDLEKTSRAKDDIRVIVLVTDGLPEDKTRDRESELIRRDLVPRLERAGIRLYVLAFSAKAHANAGFFDSMLEGSGPVPLGARFVDPDGGRLLDNMLEIFGRSFGYTPDQARRLPGVTDLDLEKDVTPERVAVVVSSNRAEAPTLELKAPPDGKVQNPAGLQQASEPGASYAVRWVLVPDPGRYGFDTDATRGAVAVLRPTRLELVVRAVEPHRADRTMARTRLKLEVLVRSPTGSGDPGSASLSFQPFGPRNPSGEGDRYRWQGEQGAARSETGQLAPEGRVYEIDVEFPENQDDPSEKYGGFLEVEARRGEALVGSLTFDRAHWIEVHPLLSIKPFPATDLASATALDSGESGCTEFTLEIAQGRLPHPDQPEYGLSAVLRPDPPAIDQQLREANFSLDGRLLELAGKGTKEWYKGRKLTLEELLLPHEICVNLGEPTQGADEPPLLLPLELTLQESPYDEFGVVEPFTLKLRIATPTVIEKWGRWILAGLALLGILLALWYLRDRPSFPGDLRYAVSREGSPQGLVAVPLPDGSAVSRLLGLVVERPVRLPGEDRALGRVRPVDEELYRLRMARGVHIEPTEPGAPVPLHGKLAELEAHRTYRLRTDEHAYLFRMEYE